MRYNLAENPYIIGRFGTGDTVNITIYDLSDNSIAAGPTAMSEILTTGYFKYQFNPSPAGFSEYLYIMTNSIEEHAGKIVLADNTLGEIVEGTLTMKQVLRLIKAFIAGKTSGGGTTSIKFRDDADSKDRIIMTVDKKGNRSTVIVDET